MKQKKKFIKTQEIINSLFLKLVPQFFLFRTNQISASTKTKILDKCLYLIQKLIKGEME